MEIPNPLSIDMASALLGIRHDQDLAVFFGCQGSALSYIRRKFDGNLPAPRRAQVEAELLRRELDKVKTAQAGAPQ